MKRVEWTGMRKMGEWKGVGEMSRDVKEERRQWGGKVRVGNERNAETDR